MASKHCYLSTHDLFCLDRACKLIASAFGDVPYLVGSAGERPDYRDVDVRLILDDAQFDALFAERKELWAFVSFTTAAWLKGETGLPIDFQIQRRTEANEKHKGHRNPVGIRELTEFAGGGDGTNFRES